MLKILPSLPFLALLAAPALAEEPAPDALYGKWQAVEIGGAATAAEVKSTLLIAADGSVGGQGGCNLYFGNATVEGGSIAIGGLGSTMMACEAPAMEQEQQLFAALESAKSWTLDGSRLVLRDDKGQPAAVFVPVATVMIDIPDARAETQTLSYRCDDTAMNVTYINAGATALAVLTLEGETIVAANVLAASGAKYAGQQYVWWTKGPHADLYDLTQGEDAEPLGCDQVQ